MGRVIPHEILLKIEGMSYVDKVIDLFKIFPGNQRYFEDLLLSVCNAKRGINVSCISSEIYLVEVYVTGMGTLKKHWEMDDQVFQFSFCVGDDYGEGILSEPFNKKDSDIFCERALPFMLSYGHNKQDIPLLINDFPEFSKYALEYVP